MAMYVLEVVKKGRISYDQLNMGQWMAGFVGPCMMRIVNKINKDKLDYFDIG